MPRDLDDLLAEGAPRDPGRPDLAAIESRAARRRTGRAGATVIALVAAIGIAFQSMPSQPDRPIIGDLEQTVEGATVLPLPDRGAVNADHANGRPVFVVHDLDGDVRVLDAISPHDSIPDAQKVLAYCSTSGWFEDPWHGSKFGRNGGWAGGPAPHGLAEHEVVEVTGDTVVVGRLRSAPARGLLRAPEPAGRDCGDTLTGVRTDDIVLHLDVDDDRVPGLLYPQRPAGDPDSGLLLPDQPQEPLAGEPVELPVPPVDGVLAAHIGERPVFVLARDDGTGGLSVTVLDAVNPHVTEFGPKVLAWCRSTLPVSSVGEVYDPWYLSRFTPVGAAVSSAELGGGLPAGGWTGGPAPSGLARYAVLGGSDASGAPLTIRVAGSPLPAVPRVDLGGAPDVVAVPTGQCDGRDQLFPDMPPADPTLLTDLVLHEPLFPELWWYPTPARLLGEEPGLPSDELDRYLDEVAPDAVSVDTLDDVPAMGQAGLAHDSPLGVAFTDLDGTELALVRGASLVQDPRDGNGGAVLLRLADGTEHWLAPSDGTSLPADGVTVVGRDAFVEQADGTWATPSGYPEPLVGPLAIGDDGAVVTGPDCVGRSCEDPLPTPAFAFLTDGLSGAANPGCVVTDGFSHASVLEVCDGADGAFVRTVPDDAEFAPQRWDVPRYAGQPAEVATIGRFTDAVYGPVGPLAELRLECESRAVVLLRDGGVVADPWGGDSWEDTPTSRLLGATRALDGGREVPLVQVAADACGDTATTTPGVWAFRDSGPTLLNQVTATAVLWTDSAGGLDALAAELTVAREARDRCAGDEPSLVGAVDVDDDGLDDRVLRVPDGFAEPLLLCTGAGVARPFGVLHDPDVVQVLDLGSGPRDVLVGVTDRDGMTNLELYRWVGRPEDGNFGTVDRYPASSGPVDDLDALVLETTAREDGSSVAWGCLPPPFANSESTLVVVTVTTVEDAVRVRTERYDLRALSATPIDDATEAGPTGLTAADVLADLDARPSCEVG